MENIRITVIGGGAMGGSLVRGLLAGGYDASLITLSTPHPARVEDLSNAGVRTLSDNVEAIRDAELVVVAVKPWVLPGVADELKTEIDPDRQEITAIVAGVSCDDLCNMFRNEGPLPGLSISMPNTAMSLGESMTFLVRAHGECSMAMEIFGRVGKVMDIEERLLGAGTALASCGIAYAMRYVRAAVEGGVQLGFPATRAQDIVIETIRGAAALLSQPGAHPESEIDHVTTPGGLTIRGLNAMEAAGFTNAVIRGLTVNTPHS